MKLPALPPPTSFAEGQRMIFGCLVALSGMFCGACAVAMICLLMWGGFSAKEEHTIVVILGWSLGGFIASMAAVIMALAVGGPVGKFSGKVGKDGASFEASDHESAPTVTTTTTVTPSPPVAPPKPDVTLP
jgi:hypothetical protein